MGVSALRFERSPRSRCGGRFRRPGVRWPLCASGDSGRSWRVAPAASARPIALDIAREGADVVVGTVVLLAATPESRLVTGASVFIDGGQTIWGA